MPNVSISSDSSSSLISRNNTYSSSHTSDTPVQVKASDTTANLTSIQCDYIPVDNTQTIAHFELDDSLPYRLSKHVIKKLSSELLTNPQLDYSFNESQKLSNLLIALIYIKTFKQLWSSLNITIPQNDEERILHEISQINIAVPERIDVLLSGLGNIQTNYGVMKLLWPITTCKTCLVNALKYGSAYFGEKVFSRFFPSFENGYTSNLIWNDEEGYDKFIAYCVRYLNKYGPISNSIEEARTSIPRWFHDENPNYLIVYSAHMTTREEWYGKLDKFDSNDDVVRSLDILGLEFCSIQSLTLQTTSTRISISYDKFESLKFDQIFKMRKTKGTGKGCLGQLCQSIGKKSYSSAFPFTDSNRTYGYMLKPSVFYEVVNRARASMLFSEMVD